MSEPLIQHVSDTAYLIAYFRAVESERSDALFHDPLAARLSGDKGKAIGETLVTRKMTAWNTAIRTVLIDAYVRAALERGVDLVLNLGAGLDTRPYRLELPPALTWVEVDYPDVVAYKEERLAAEAPRCRLERLGVDLGDPAARARLLAAIDARASRILVLTEGVVIYLDEPHVANLADELRSLAHIDSWIVDYVSAQAHAYRERTGVTKQMQQTPFKFRPADWFAFFEAHGWKPREIRYLIDEGNKLGRPAPLPWLARVFNARPLRALVPPERLEGVRKMSGYVLLEPASDSSTRSSAA